jgi:hypothetical protein|nr:MAG TPA: Protein of unknown function (DUF1642) [Caudoviricetes sp.]
MNKQDEQELRTNKQELISKYELIKNSYNFKVVATDGIISDLKRLDEPEKVTIPQFVAGWIEYCKFTHVNLQYALVVGDVYFYNYANQKDFSKLKEFLETENNQVTFARAWLDGYTIEEERRYFVKIRATKHYFSRDGKGKIFFSLAYKDSFTKKELEEANFGWVFDCEGIEIEEVE